MKIVINIKKEKLKSLSFRASFIPEMMICGQYKTFRLFSFDGVFDFVSFLLKRCQASISSLSAHPQSLPTGHTGLYHQGACGIAEEATPNCSKSRGVIPTMICRKTLTGSRSLSFAVLIMVVIKDTFCLPCEVILPKVIFLKITSPLSPCSAGLFVGGKAMILKESFSAFYEAETAEEALEILEEWTEQCKESELKPFKKLAKRLNRWKDGILAYFTHKITNGMAEGINNKIKVR